MPRPGHGSPGHFRSDRRRPTVARHEIPGKGATFRGRGRRRRARARRARGWVGSGGAVVNAPVAHLVVNEVDYDNVGTDTQEFIEIFNGTGKSVPLADYAVVLVNGGNNLEYSRTMLADGGNVPGRGPLPGDRGQGRRAGSQCPGHSLPGRAGPDPERTARRCGARRHEHPHARRRTLVRRLDHEGADRWLPRPREPRRGNTDSSERLQHGQGVPLPRAQRHGHGQRRERLGARQPDARLRQRSERPPRWGSARRLPAATAATTATAASTRTSASASAASTRTSASAPAASAGTSATPLPPPPPPRHLRLRTSAATTTATASTSTVSALPGAAGPRPTASSSQEAHPCQALRSGSRSPRALEASGPCHRAKPSARHGRAGGLQGEARRRPPPSACSLEDRTWPEWGMHDLCLRAIIRSPTLGIEVHVASAARTWGRGGFAAGADPAPPLRRPMRARLAFCPDGLANRIDRKRVLSFTNGERARDPRAARPRIGFFGARRGVASPDPVRDHGRDHHEPRAVRLVLLRPGLGLLASRSSPRSSS